MGKLDGKEKAACRSGDRRGSVVCGRIRVLLVPFGQCAGMEACRSLGASGKRVVCFAQRGGYRGGRKAPPGLWLAIGKGHLRRPYRLPHRNGGQGNRL